MDVTTLTLEHRQALLARSLAGFIEAPSPSRKADLQAAVKEYTEAWILSMAEDPYAVRADGPAVEALLRASADAVLQTGPDGARRRMAARNFLVASSIDLEATAQELVAEARLRPATEENADVDVDVDDAGDPLVDEGDDDGDVLA